MFAGEFLRRLVRSDGKGRAIDIERNEHVIRRNKIYLFALLHIFSEIILSDILRM